MGAQIFRTKDIDKLISDSQEPDKRLKKSLGAVSLTSLGIGAVIGSGIFTVIGTAIAGQKMQFSSILNAPLLEYLIYHSASFGRPGAGPAIALSFILVAIACGFAALCYAELAAMIPVSGSAYTYSYATLGDLVARGLQANPATTFHVHSAVRPFAGTFRDVEIQARRLAAGLRSRGVGPGDRRCRRDDRQDGRAVSLLDDGERSRHRVAGGQVGGAYLRGLCRDVNRCLQYDASGSVGIGHYRER